MNTPYTHAPFVGESLIFNDYTEAPISSESITLDDHAEVSVVLRSFPSGGTDVAITFVNRYPDSDMEIGSAVELSPEDARWLGTNLLSAAEACGDGSRPYPPGVTRG